MHYVVHCRPRVGRNVGRMRLIWQVIPEITPMRRPLCVGRDAADYALILSVHCTTVVRLDTHKIIVYVNKFDVSSRLRQILSP